MVAFAAADYAVVVTFLIAILSAGFLARRAPKETVDYVVAGRMVTLPALVATLVATWYGGILAIGEYTYTYGISNWFVFGLPYYVFAIIFAFALAPRIRAAGVYSLSDRLAQVYGRRAAIFGGCITFVLITPAPYLLMMGVLLGRVFGLDTTVAIFIGAAVATIYLYYGGLPADIRVNIVQFVAMFAGIGISVPLAVSQFGGLEYLQTHLPQGHWRWDGGNGLIYMLTWFFIAIWTLVDPGFHQRAAAANDPKVAKRAVLWAVVCWAVFDFLTTTAGLYARAVLGEGLKDPSNAFPLFADKILPVGFRGAFYVGMLASVTSALVSYSFIGGVAFGRDLVWRIRGETTEERVNLYTRIGIAVATLVGIGIAVYFGSVVKIWFYIGSCMIPGLLIPTVFSFFPAVRPSPACARWLMVVGTVASSAWFAWGQRHLVDGMPTYPLPLEPMYPGLILTTLIWLGTWVAGRKGRRTAETH